MIIDSAPPTDLYHHKLNHFAGGAKSCGGGRPPGWLSDIAPSGRLPSFWSFDQILTNMPQVEMLPSLASLPEGLQQALTMQEEQVGKVKMGRRFQRSF